MAKIARLPNASIISGFKGKVDFYIHRGIPCARKWPRSPGRKRTAAVKAQWSDWADASRIWTTLSPEIQAFYNQMASGSGMSGRDLFTRGYITGIYRYEPPA